MVRIESKLNEIFQNEDVNTKLWSCSVILLVETSSAFSDYPTQFVRHASVIRRPALHCVSLSQLAVETVRTTIKLEGIRKEWPTIFNRLKASGCVDGLPEETKINLDTTFGKGATRQAAVVKTLLLNMRERMLDVILETSETTGIRMGASKGVSAKSNLRPRERRADIKKGVVDGEVEWSEIEDHPQVGPHVYMILTGFYDPRILFSMIRMKIPISCIIAVGGDPSQISPRNFLQREDLVGHQFHFQHFWAQFNWEKLDLTKAMAYNDVAVVPLNLEKEAERIENQPEGIETKPDSDFSTALVSVIYDVTTQMRNYLHYNRNSVVRKIPKFPASRIDLDNVTRVPDTYSSLVDLLPREVITVEYILHCMVEHITNSLTDSDVELSTNGPTQLWNPQLRMQRLHCHPALIHSKDTVTQLFLSAKSQLPFDLGVIHANIHSLMPYSLLWSRYNIVKPDRVKHDSHMYKLWRCSESVLPFQTFQDHFNLVILSKLYNTVVEPIRLDQLETLFKFIFLRSDIVTFDPKQFQADKLQNESIKLRDFVQCLEILNAFDFPPTENEPIASYNAFDELETVVCLQCLQKAFSSFNDMFYAYYPPTDRMLIWFHNDIRSDQLNSYIKKGTLSTPVGFADFFKFTKTREQRWLSTEKLAMAEYDAKANEAYIKEIDSIKVRSEKNKEQETKSYQIPLNFAVSPAVDNSSPQKVLYDVEQHQIENKEQVTEFVTAEGTVIKAKIHEWAYGSDRVLSLIMNCDGTILSHHRVIVDRLENKGSDDGKIGISMISPDQDVFVNYDVTTSFTVASGGGQDDEVKKKQSIGHAEKGKRAGSMVSRKSLKKKSIAVGGKRMSVKKKSIASGGGKRMSVKKKSIASGGGKRMSVKKKSIAGGGKRMSVKKKSIAGGGEKRQSMKKRLTLGPEDKKRKSSIKSISKGEREQAKVIETTDFEFKATTRSGLLVTFPVIEDVRVVKQEFLRDVTTGGCQLQERYRLFLPDGEILVYKDDGDIILFHTNSTITRITQINRIVNTVFKDRTESGLKQDPKDIGRNSSRKSQVSRKSRLSIKKKSIAGGAGKRMSVKKKSIAGGAGKRMSVKKKSIAGGAGKRMSVKKKSIAGGAGKRMSVKKKSIAGGAGKRMSVKKKSIGGGGGKRQSMRKSLGGRGQSLRKSLGGTQGPKKSSHLIPVEVVTFEIGKHEVVDHYGKRKFYIKNALENSDEAFKIRVGQEASGRIYVKRSDGTNSYYKDDGTLHVKYPDGTLEEEKEGADSNEFITWTLKHTLEHPNYARVEWNHATPTVTLPDNTTVTTSQTVPFSVKMHGVAVNFNQTEATVHSFDPRAPHKITSSKFSFPLLRHLTEPSPILESVDSWGRTFQVLTDGTVNYDWPERQTILEHSGPVYDVNRFNKFFVVDRRLSGLELVQDDETNENQPKKLLIKPKTTPFYTKQVPDYFFQDIRPAEMAKKELTRYLIFPEQQWLFNLPKYANDCLNLPCRPIELVPRAKRLPSAILHEVMHTILRYDTIKRFKDAVHRYATFHEILFKKYLTYLHELEDAVKIKAPFVISVDSAEGIVGKYIAVENSLEREKLLSSDGCFNKGDTVWRTYLKPMVRQEEKLTNILNF